MTNNYSLKQPKKQFVNIKNSTRTTFSLSINVHSTTCRNNRP